MEFISEIESPEEFTSHPACRSVVPAVRALFIGGCSFIWHTLSGRLPLHLAIAGSGIEQYGDSVFIKDNLG
jgi:hypothetical protein